MAEYIEREAALTADLKICVKRFDKRIKTAQDAVQAYADYIAGLPAADVRPVVRGRWKCTALGNYACSYCSCEPYYSGSVETLKFCPNCGADMRNEK